MAQKQRTSIKRPSSKDVAKLAGVSRATVSAYLNRTRYVSPELSEKIEQAIQELHYTPDPVARALKLQDTKTIGLIIPVMSNFYMPLMQVVNEVAHQNAYGLLLCSSEEDPEREREVLEIFLAKRVSGIMMAPCSEKNRKLLNDIQQKGTPIVQVNRKIDGLEADSVVSHNFKAAYTATEHLIHKGRKRIVFLGYDPDSLVNAEKKTGYDAALADYKIADNLTILVKEHQREQIRTAFRTFLETGQSFDGLICTTQGKTAIGLQLLKAYALRIPQDVAVIGFDDTPWSSLLWPPLTVISENTYTMGEEATKLLLKRIENKEKIAPQHIVLEDELIIREST
ncbi:transcriptional regulator [Candidatus Vecturithrix granuli]|uniref:Transcriptional regulator n=1 Tax=Vecturithrix granuli TaxID=1499967 RepID=A0A081BWD8_VECG1|nr:transcriptional regulator [Candidatus Vecturithrix granuli]